MNQVQTKGTAHYWCIIACMCGLAGSGIGISCNAEGVFYTVVSEDLGVLRGSFAMHATLTTLVIAAMSPIMPALLKKVSLKKILWIGVLLAMFSTAGMAFSKSLLLFNILGITRGIGCGLYGLVPISMIITNWFEKRHGLATSLALSFSGVIGAIFSPLMSAVISAVGWRAGYLVLAVSLFLLALPAMIYPFTFSPKECGMLRYGEEEEAAVGATVKSKTSGAISHTDAVFLGMSLVAFFAAFGTGIPQHFTGYSIQVGLTAAVGATMLSFAMTGNIIAKLSIGVLSDKIGPVRATLAMIGATCVASVLLLLGGVLVSPTILMGSALLFGANYAVGAVASSLLTRYFYGEEHYAEAYGIIGALPSVGAALALTVFGYVYDFTGTYANCFYLTIALQAIMVVLILFLDRRKKATK